MTIRVDGGGNFILAPERARRCPPPAVSSSRSLSYPVPGDGVGEDNLGGLLK